MREPDILLIISNLLKVLNIKITKKTILENIHYRLWHETDPLIGMSNAIRDCGIDAQTMDLHLDLFDKLPLYSLIPFKDGTTNTPYGEFFMLLEKGEKEIKLLNQRFEPLIISKAELITKWSGLVIAIDTEEACDEIDYNIPLTETNKITNSNELGVSVIMPVYNQAHFVKKALKSLFLQSHENWELIIIDDGSTDDLDNIISSYCANKRIHYYKNENNKGLGASINLGLDKASFDIISYLPADDFYFRHHLKLMVETLLMTNSHLVYSGIKYKSTGWVDNNYGYYSYGKINNTPLQLVQVLHKKIDSSFIERDTLVTDDLNIMYWNNFFNQNKKIIGTREITCEWLDHPDQRHKTIAEDKGGNIFLFKERYGIKHPIKFKSSVGNLIDETQHYNYIKNSENSHTNNSNNLKILLVGDLTYNPERVLAFEERGHLLYGLWMNKPSIGNASGNLPFGNIQQIPFNNWFNEVSRIKPDIIYAQQDYRAVPLAHHVLMNNPGIPFISHFKESPFHSMDSGTFRQYIDLYSKSDGQIYTSKLMMEWMQQYLGKSNQSYFILDGDLPKIDCFSNEKTELLSKKDGAIHTVVVGRPLGLENHEVIEILKQNIHIHIYGNIFHHRVNQHMNEYLRIAPNHIHLHNFVSPENWVKEFSKYDAGWLHHFYSKNNNDILQLNWHDLNMPARMTQYAMSGLPMLFNKNTGHRVACREMLEKENMVILYDSLSDLSKHFSNREELEQMRDKIWQKRFQFSFDYHVDDLIDFFHKTIKSRKLEPQNNSKLMVNL